MTMEHGEGASRVQQPNQPRQTDSMSSLLELGGVQDGGDDLEGAERIGRERGGDRQAGEVMGSFTHIHVIWLTCLSNHNVSSTAPISLLHMLGFGQ